MRQIWCSLKTQVCDLASQNLSYSEVLCRFISLKAWNYTDALCPRWNTPMSQPFKTRTLFQFPGSPDLGGSCLHNLHPSSQPEASGEASRHVEHSFPTTHIASSVKGAHPNHLCEMAT